MSEWQINMFVNRLTGQQIGVSVLGIFVINKNTILAVRTHSTFLTSYDCCNKVTFYIYT